MTNKEKKVVEKLKEEVDRPLKCSEEPLDTFILIDIEDCKTILNIIEKQQEEIEYLKGQIPQDKIFYYSEKDFISKDEIREKLKRKREDINYTYYDFYLDFKELLGEEDE